MSSSNYSWTRCFKNCRNISTDGKVMSKIKVACFFLGHGVYTYYCVFSLLLGGLLYRKEILVARKKDGIRSTRWRQWRQWWSTTTSSSCQSTSVRQPVSGSEPARVEHRHLWMLWRLLQLSVLITMFHCGITVLILYSSWISGESLQSFFYVNK